MTEQEIEQLIAVSDPDGVWSMMRDLGDCDAMEYIENKYFNQ
jgi:hypothetical protein